MSNTTELDPIGVSILVSDSASSTYLGNIIQSLMLSKQVNAVVESVTNKTVCFPQYTLSYLICQFCGIELNEYGSDQIDPRSLLDRLGTNDSADCPTSKVFLLLAMAARTKNTRAIDPNSQLYNFQARAVFLMRRVARA